MRLMNNVKNGFVVVALLFSFLNYGVANKGKETDDSYWSDSEDEQDYTWQGFSTPEIPKKAGDRCLLLSRGIHFSPSLFTKKRMSKMKKHDDTGKPHCSAAAFDLAKVPLGEPGDNPNVLRKAKSSRKLISSLSQKERNKFQQTYSNSDNTFHVKLAKPTSERPFNKFLSERNPQVSTSESFRHSIKYALGLKFLGIGRDPLDPAYDDQGKPRHPYLGKLFVFLIDEKKVDKLDPYFVVHAHANNEITIYSHFRNDVLSEREVSFPGFIPGEFVVFSIPVRVPSFKGEYEPWYEQKYGITKRIFNARKRILTTGKYHSSTKSSEDLKKDSVHSLLEKVILPHLASKLETNVKQACKQKGTAVVYKKLNGKYGPQLPDFFNVSQRRNALA